MKRITVASSWVITEIVCLFLCCASVAMAADPLKSQQDLVGAYARKLAGKLPAAPAAAAGPTKPRQIHALLIADGFDPQLGSGFRESFRRVRDLLQSAFPKVAGKSELTLYEVGVNSPMTVKAIEEAVAKIQSNATTTGSPTENIAVFCFYFAHGGQMSYSESVARTRGDAAARAIPQSEEFFFGHFFACTQEENRVVPRYNLWQALKATNAGLTVLLSDSCFERARPAGLRTEMPDSAALKPHGTIRRLLENYSGDVNCTSSSVGELSWYFDAGLFTEAFIGFAQEDLPVDWRTFFQEVRDQTDHAYRRTVAAAGQPHQLPLSFLDLANIRERKSDPTPPPVDDPPMPTENGGGGSGSELDDLLGAAALSPLGSAAPMPIPSSAGAPLEPDVNPAVPEDVRQQFKNLSVWSPRTSSAQWAQWRGPSSNFSLDLESVRPPDDVIEFTRKAAMGKAAAAAPAGTRRVHLLIVADCLDGQIGKGAQASKAALIDLFSTAFSQIPGVDLSILPIIGEHQAPTVNDVKNAVQSIQVSSQNDVIYCHLLAHGSFNPALANDRNQSFGHQFNFGTETLPRVELFRALQRKPAAMLVLASDSCNVNAFNPVPVPAGAAIPTLRDLNQSGSALRRLLLRYRGTVDLSGASQNQLCWYKNETDPIRGGGIFSQVLVGQAELSASTLTWRAFYDNVSGETNRSYQAMRNYWLDPMNIGLLDNTTKSNLQTQTKQMPFLFPATTKVREASELAAGPAPAFLIESRGKEFQGDAAKAAK